MKEFSDETKNQEVEQVKTEDEETTEDKKFNQKYEQLSDDEKSKFNEQFADKKVYNDWKKDNPNGTLIDFGNSIFEKMDKEKHDNNIDVGKENSKEYKPYSDKMGEYREVPPCGLSCLMTQEDYEIAINGSKFEKNGQTFGAPDGKFVAPYDQMSSVIEEADGDFDKIKDSLGMRKKGEHTMVTKEDYLIRIDINKSDADKLNPRYPTGFETGADKGFPKQKETADSDEESKKKNDTDKETTERTENKEQKKENKEDENNDELDMWTGGGKTVSEEGKPGIDEYVIDQIDVNKVNISVSVIYLKKDT